MVSVERKGLRRGWSVFHCELLNGDDHVYTHQQLDTPALRLHAHCPVRFCITGGHSHKRRVSCTSRCIALALSALLRPAAPRHDVTGSIRRKGAAVATVGGAGAAENAMMRRLQLRKQSPRTSPRPRRSPRSRQSLKRNLLKNRLENSRIRSNAPPPALAITCLTSCCARSARTATRPPRLSLALR